MILVLWMVEAKTEHATLPKNAKIKAAPIQGAARKALEFAVHVSNSLRSLRPNFKTSFSRTMFENYSKSRILIFQFWHFPTIFVLSKLTCLETLFDNKLQVFK